MLGQIKIAKRAGEDARGGKKRKHEQCHGAQNNFRNVDKVISQVIPNAGCINSLKMLARKQRICGLYLFSTTSASKTLLSHFFSFLFFFWSAQRPSLKSSNLFLKRDLGIQDSPVNLEIVPWSFAASQLENRASEIVLSLPEQTNLLPVTVQHFLSSILSIPNFVVQSADDIFWWEILEMPGVFCLFVFFFAFKLLLERRVQMFLPRTSYPANVTPFRQWWQATWA